MPKNISLALALQAAGLYGSRPEKAKSPTTSANPKKSNRISDGELKGTPTPNQNQSRKSDPKKGDMRHRNLRKNLHKQPKIKSGGASRSRPVPVYRGPLVKSQYDRPNAAGKNESTSKLRLELHSQVALKKDTRKGFVLLSYSANEALSGSFDPDLDSIDLVVGLDFGTSSTKVAVRDKTLDRNYLVPFRESVGVERYLLPSRIFLGDNGQYSLIENGAGEWIRDLKLPLLSGDVHVDSRSHAVAYLSIVLRHVRNWLLAEFGSRYSGCNLFWAVHLGVPSEAKIDEEQSEFFKSLIGSAWRISQLLDEPNFEKCCLHPAALLDLVPESEMDPEFHVFAELAAQVTGFCTSDQFDPDKANYYLVIDVGAGTVDSCLLRIDRDKQKHFVLTFFAFNVAHHGVINLHRTRLNWMIELIDRIKVERDKVEELVTDLKTAQESADLDTHVPSFFTDYVMPCTWDQSGGDKGPDADFMTHSLKRQVISDTVYLPVKNGVAPLGAAEDLPVFLCGGGSMHPYFQGVFESIQKQSGVSWISTRKKHLIPPENLHAPTLEASQYHRMSVAFGLAIRPMMEERLSNEKYEGIYRLTSNWSEAGMVTKDMV